MGIKYIGTILLICSYFNPSWSQTQFWSDNFEDAGAPSSGSRTPSSSFSCILAPATVPTAYFKRSNISEVNLAYGPYTGIQGSKFWAGEDIDYGTSCVNSSQSPNQQVTWSGINIAGKAMLSFKGLFAANNLTGGNWEGKNWGASQDFIMIEYRIDNGTWTKIIAFYADAVSNSPSLKLDTDNDQLGDGTTLTYVFTEYEGTIIESGNVLDIRLNCSSNNSAVEEFAVDDFRLFEGAPLPTQIISFEAYKEKNCAVLNWKTPAEGKDASFLVERSSDGKEYNTIGLANDSLIIVNKLYRFIDEAPIVGNNFYRILQKQNDGSNFYSNVEYLNFGNSLKLKCYPNPVKEELKVDIIYDVTATATITLTDVLGKTVIKKSNKLNIGINTLHIPLLNLPSGVYNLKVLDKQNILLSTRVTKE